MEPSRPPFFQALAEPQSPDLFRKLVLLAGARLLVGTALLIATATLTLSSGAETFPRPVEAFLYAIIASIYLGSLVSVWFLRARRHLSTVAHVQIIGDVVAASGLVYLTGGAESVFTILYPLAIVNAAIGLGRRGALLGAVLSGLTFCLLAVGMERAWFSLPISFLDRAPLQMPRLLLTLAANLSAFGVLHGPPKAVDAPNPASSIIITRTVGAFSGGRSCSIGSNLVSGSLAS